MSARVPAANLRRTKSRSIAFSANRRSGQRMRLGQCPRGSAARNGFPERAKPQRVPGVDLRPRPSIAFPTNGRPARRARPPLGTRQPNAEAVTTLCRLSPRFGPTSARFGCEHPAEPAAARASATPVLRGTTSAYSPPCAGEVRMRISCRAMRPGPLLRGATPPHPPSAGEVRTYMCCRAGLPPPAASRRTRSPRSAARAIPAAPPSRLRAPRA